MEENMVDEQYQLLDKQAREALSKREELLREQESQRRKLDEEAEIALKTKEKITKHLMLQRKLKEKEMELEKAALITSFLKEETSSPVQSRPLSESEFNPRLPVDDKGVPPHSQGELGPLHSTPYANAPPPIVIPAAYGQVRDPQMPLLYPQQHPTLRDAAPQSHSYPTMPPLQQVTAPPPGSRASPGTDLMELLIATSYGLPRPALPPFTSGKESDFALLKMALDNLLNSHTHLTEQFKYQVLLDHLKLPSAYKLAQAYMHDPMPYTSALQALQDKYGQPRQLVQSELGAIFNSSPIKFGDPEAFDNFALSVQALVGMLRSLEGENGYELRCGSHVDRLLSKLPANYRDSFVEYSLNHGILRTGD
ncbi:hypothetical protein NFI96_006961 [Prochilodus magdalenae]|nr:hypothetical protein NFI96_006961 [Prochilodus magdalenae]